MEKKPSKNGDSVGITDIFITPTEKAAFESMKQSKTLTVMTVIMFCFFVGFLFFLFNN